MATRLTLDQESLGSSPSGAATQLSIIIKKSEKFLYIISCIFYCSGIVIVLKQARSSSGLGRCPLKAETTGSNPVRATPQKFFVRQRLRIFAK